MADFQQPGPIQQPSPHLQPGIVPGEGSYDDQFRPGTLDVAVFIKNRTVDRNNNFIGDFTSETTVTGDEVDHIIDEAGTMVLSALHWDPTHPESIPEDNIATTKFLIALLSALFVEVTKFSEQISRQVSPYPYLKELFDNMLAQKQGELGIVSGGGKTGMTIIDIYLLQAKQPEWEFPNDPMVGWKTAF